MKNELKISTLSIVCVLCTAMAMPSFGAPAVRSLGGAGTYSSASSAASTGSKSASTAKSTVRGGSMRVGDAKPTTSTSTRAAASPRLSIGKYLGGVTTVGGSKPSSGGNLGQAGVAQRVTKLEDALDALTGRVSVNETAIATLGTGLESLKNTVDGLGGIASGDLLNRVADLESTVRGLQSGGASGETVTQLQEDVEGLSSQVESVVAQLENVATQEDIKDFVKSDAVESMIQDLATKGEITALQTEMAKLATKDSLKVFVTSDYVTQAIAGLQTADQVSQAIDAKIANLATKAELETAKSELQAAIDNINAGQVELTNYYTKADADAKFATKAEIPDMTQYVTTTQVDTTVSNAMNTYEIPDGSITTDKIQAGAVTSDEINTGAAEGEMVMLMSNGDGTSSWVSVTVDAE